MNKTWRYIIYAPIKKLVNKNWCKTVKKMRELKMKHCHFSAPYINLYLICKA